MTVVACFIAFLEKLGTVNPRVILYPRIALSPGLSQFFNDAYQECTSSKVVVGSDLL